MADFELGKLFNCISQYYFLCYDMADHINILSIILFRFKYYLYILRSLIVLCFSFLSRVERSTDLIALGSIYGCGIHWSKRLNGR